MKSLNSISKKLSSVDVEKLLGNQMKNIKGGSLSKGAPCWNCTSGCKPGCLTGQVSRSS